MTNQEYLAERIQKLSAEEVYDLLYDILINEGSRYNSSRAGIAQWLTEESKEAKYILSLPSAEPIDVQEAYYRGKIDGIKECAARLKKVNEEVANG